MVFVYLEIETLNTDIDAIKENIYFERLERIFGKDNISLYIKMHKMEAFIHG